MRILGVLAVAVLASKPQEQFTGYDDAGRLVVNGRAIRDYYGETTQALPERTTCDLFDAGPLRVIQAPRPNFYVGVGPRIDGGAKYTIVGPITYEFEFPIESDEFWEDDFTCGNGAKPKITIAGPKAHVVCDARRDGGAR